MRQIRPGIEKYLDSVIYAPSYVQYKKFLHKTKFPYYTLPLKIKCLEWFTKVFHKIPLPISPKAYFNIKDYDMYPIAQTHLDAAWLWTVRDTKVRAFKTFYAALKHITEFPYFSVTITSPQYFSWIKRYDSKMWEEVKDQVACNRIDICGGMWIEPALRMCSGEALVRQRLYGQLFYLRNFGKISKVESLLDVFGFPYSIPQILVKSGAESFWTTKLTWNDHSAFPFSNYIWRGLDGSEIFTHMFKFQKASIYDFGLYKKMARRPKEKGLVFHSSNSLKEMNDALSEDHVRTLGWFYGRGDGGKGPLMSEILYMENFARYFGNFSKGFKHTNTHRYFNILKQDVGDQIVTWDDEMYLEFHRGCLTTHARVKEGNRKSEESTIAAEFLNTLFLLSPEYPDFEYPKEVFEDCWQKILFNQFHDILPGSSIPEVYLLTYKEHEYVYERMQSLLKVRLYDLTTRLPTKSGDILLYNPISVDNETYISIGDRDYKISNMDPLSLIVVNKDEIAQSNHSNNPQIRVESQPARIKVENNILSVSFSKSSGNLVELNLKTQKAIDNFLYGERNQVKESTEKLILKDNTIKKHKLRFKGARIRVFGEPMRSRQPYPAWNIDHSYTTHPILVKLVEGPIVTQNKTNVTVSSNYCAKKSNFTIQYTIREDSDAVDLDIHMDLQDKKTFVKYFIPVNLKSENVRCEIPYGSILRSRNPKSEMEEGKWEYGMQKWVDVSDSDVGLAILNNSKYGVSANMKGISISLVRSPHYPKDSYHTREIKLERKKRPSYTDLGKHYVKLRLVPHVGSWLENTIPHKALAFNNPVVIIEPNYSEENKSQVSNISTTNSVDERGIRKTLVKFPRISSDHPNVIVSSFKPSEWIAKDEVSSSLENGYAYEDYFLPESPLEWKWDKKTLIIRAYECGGSQLSTNIRLHNIPEDYELQAEEMDLLEYKIGKELEVVRNVANQTMIIRTNFKPFEIKSIRLSLVR